MKTKFTLMGAFLLLAIFSHAQNPLKGKVSGLILDEASKPSLYTNVLLLRQKDSSLVKGEVSDGLGKFQFTNVSEGSYIIAATMVGYKKSYSKPLQINAENLDVIVPSIQMATETKNLKEVVVVGQKPFIEQKIDKTIVNVENSIVSSGSTAMEVLEKAPGVTIDKDDNISLRGKQGVIVMIDGKQTYMSSGDVSNMLRNMQSNAIENIEIITNPSAKYDAAGNSGIINIRLKKNKNMGTNGSFTLGAGYGKFEKTNAGLSVNNRNGKWNLFGNYNYGYNHRFNSNTIVRQIDFNNETFISDSYNYRPMQVNANSFKGGADYYINKNHTIGVMASGFLNFNEMDVENTTDFRSTGTASDSSLFLGNLVDSRWSSQAYNLNYKGVLDSTGKELTVDLDFSQFRGDVSDNLNISRFDDQGEINGNTFNLFSTIPSTITIRSAKLDYVHPFSKKAKMEAGAKSSYVTNDNNVVYEELKDGNRARVDSLSNHFRYNEAITAGYVNYSTDFGKFAVQLGLRGEYTFSDGKSLSNSGLPFSRRYFQLFPSVFLTQKINKSHTLNYSYSRRIDRPSYRDLNTAIQFLDPYTYFQGNVYVMPQYTNAFQVTHSFKGFVNTSVGFSTTSDVFTQVPEQNNETKVTKATIHNIGVMNNINLSIGAPIPFSKIWMSNNNINLFYKEYHVDYQGIQSVNGRTAFNFNTNHTIKLPKNYTIELNGMYNSPSAEGILRQKAMYVFGFGAQKTFMDKRASLKLNVNDVFNMMRFRGTINFGDMDVQILSRWESRIVRLTFTYRFGKNEIKPARRRTTGVESEQNRVKME
jgi:hypothetical protein